MAFQSFASEFAVNVRNMTEEAAKAAMQRAVGSEIQRVRSQQAARSGGIVPDLEAMVVDGNRAGNVAQIGHNSTVVLDWNYLSEAVIRTVLYLETQGPERSGEWKRSIITLVEGVEVGRTQRLPRLAREALVVVTAPYARRLEVGKREGGGPFVLQVPQHFVEKAVIRLRRQHGDLAKFYFTYANLSGGSRQRSAGSRADRLAAREANADVAYPAIRIEEVQAI